MTPGTATGEGRAAQTPAQVLPGRGSLLAAIGGVYVTQSLVTGIAMMSMPALMRAAGMSLQWTGLVALFMLPWGLKFLWAPALERWRIPAAPAPRRSRRLILGGQWLLAGCLLLLAAFGLAGTAAPGDVTLASASGPALLLALWVAATLAATIDIACDGFAVEQLATVDRGWGNMAQVGGSYVGIALGGSGFLLLAQDQGWPLALIAAAALVVLMTMPLLRWQGREASSAPGAPGLRPSLRRALANAAVRRGLLLTLACALGVRLAAGMLTPLLVDRGASLTLIGLLNGLLGVGCGLLGSVLGGALVARLDAGRAVVLAVLAQTLTLAMLALAAATPAPLALLAGLLGLQVLVMAAGFVAIYAVLMAWASPQQAGVDFTLFQCADALVATLAGVAGGFVAQQWGYSACFGLAALAASLAVAVALRLLRGGAGSRVPAFSIDRGHCS